MQTKKTLRKHGTKERTFTVLIEQDEDGFYVASVPALRSCYTQAKTLEELSPRIREVVSLCLEEEEPVPMKFIGVQRLQFNN
ncbi:MAG TPA: type II toxin-antitoxin system HicB family antitoxin [Blastocatellia bacterium]|jgi:predicted RNase H-like HicB family nuclease|nr:type II toxin-antitoxin system HicB family antitoxin [Blastocatellia bacterium]